MVIRTIFADKSEALDAAEDLVAHGLPAEHVHLSRLERIKAAGPWAARTALIGGAAGLVFGAFLGYLVGLAGSGVLIAPNPASDGVPTTLIGPTFLTLSEPWASTVAFGLGGLLVGALFGVVLGIGLVARRATEYDLELAKKEVTLEVETESEEEAAEARDVLEGSHYLRWDEKQT